MKVRTRALGSSDAWAEPALVALLAVALIFGGGSRGTGDFVVHLAALPVLFLAVSRWNASEAPRTQRLFVAWWSVALLVVIAQLVPLPFELWRLIGPREQVADHLALAGAADGWRPLTLDIGGTARALVSMALFGATVVLAITVSQRARERLLLWALVIGVGMALLGYAQAAAGPHTSLRFHAFHNSVGAIGTFANRNHFASFMAMLVPLAFAFAWQMQHDERLGLPEVLYSAGVLLILGAALSFSRAGTLLAVGAGVVTLVVLAFKTHGNRRSFTPAAVGSAGLAAVAVYAWDGLARRLVEDPLDDARLQYLQYGLDAAARHLSWGAGAGSFRWIYAQSEPTNAMAHTHALHAHSELVEVAIEGGAVGLLLIAGLAVLLGIAARKNLIDRKHCTALNPALLVAAAAPLLHSLVDYPLRTLAIVSLFALVVAQLIAGSTSLESSR